MEAGSGFLRWLGGGSGAAGPDLAIPRLDPAMDGQLVAAATTDQAHMRLQGSGGGQQGATTWATAVPGGGQPVACTPLQRWPARDMEVGAVVAARWCSDMLRVCSGRPDLLHAENDGGVAILRQRCGSVAGPRLAG